MTPAALVLDGHSRAAVETLQSLGGRGIAVDVSAESDCIGWKSRYCRRRLRQVNASDPPAFASWLQDLFASGDYELVVPSTELSLRGLMTLPESSAARRAAVLAPHGALQVALSKQATWELARSLGVPVPESRLITSREDAKEPTRYPVVLKPVTSVAAQEGRLIGLTAKVVTTPGEWWSALERFLPICAIQEQVHVAGRGVGVECLYRTGERIWAFQHERLHELPLTGGGSSYRRSAPVRDALLRAATLLLDRLAWHGVAMVEFRGSPDCGFFLMEINPRLWGSLALPIDAGVDFPNGLWHLARGRDPGPQPAYRSPYYTRNLEMDVDWLKENMRADHADPLLLTSPRLRSLLEYGRVLLGMESWDHFDPRDWRVWTHILAGALASAWRTAKSVAGRAARSLLLSSRHRRALARVRRDAGGEVRRLLFVCYGNICRSPLAAMHAHTLSPELEVASAGFHHIVDRVAPKRYRDIAAELGVDLSACRSRRIDAGLVQWAQLIVLADLDNLDRFKREFPEALAKTTLLGLFLPEPCAVIEDPYPLDWPEARVAAEKVLAATQRLVAWVRESPASAKETSNQGTNSAIP
jgi:protein-tyrosine-phosphatase/predicted ATP-grasp superfamily ATP-dependent carboligase